MKQQFDILDTVLEPPSREAVTEEAQRIAEEEAEERETIIMKGLAAKELLDSSQVQEFFSSERLAIFRAFRQLSYGTEHSRYIEVHQQLGAVDRLEARLRAYVMEARQIMDEQQQRAAAGHTPQFTGPPI